MKKTLLPLCFLIAHVLLGQTIDFTHLHLSLELDTNESEVHGNVQLAFKSSGKVDSIYLNGVNMEFEKVQLNNAEVKFGSDNKGIWLWPELLLDSNSISIQYTAHPRRGMFFIGWNDETGLSRRQIWTQGQGIDNRHWVPHFDEQTDKVITDIEVLFDSNYEVVSNGSLVSKTEEGKQTRWYYAMHKPHSSYLMMLAIGKYEVKKTVSKSGVSLWQYYYPDRADDYEWYYRSNEEIFNFLEQKIGVPYPWENYKQVPVQDFQHGAMENTTATILGDFFLVDEVAFNDRNYTYVNAHELAHQWFGNLVTATGSDEHWLHEGFATYYQWLSEKNLYGQDFFDWERYKAAQMVFEASKVDMVPLGNGKAGSARFYQKGAWVLYMLNQSLGDEKFDEVIKYYLEQNAFGIVTTDSLNSAIQKIADDDLSGFFGLWVHLAGEPTLSISSVAKDTSVELVAKIRGAFVKIIPLYVYYGEGSAQVRVLEDIIFDENGSGRLTISKSFSEKVLSHWVVNPNMTGLIDIKEVKDIEYVRRQYHDSELLLDRFFAIKCLEELSITDKEIFLSEIVKNTEEFFSVRAEALRQLVELKSIHAEHALWIALKSKDVHLQKEAIQLVEKPDGDLLKQVAKLRKGDSYELREVSMHKSVAGGDYEWVNDDFWLDEPGLPDHKIAITALLYRVAIYKDSAALEELKGYSSSGYEFMTRISAMQALAALKYFDKELAAHYFDALFSLNRTLSRNARGQLQALYGKEDTKAVIDEYLKNKSDGWEDFQKRTVNRTFGLNLE